MRHLLKYAAVLIICVAGVISNAQAHQQSSSTPTEKRSWADGVNLDDLVPYTQPSAAWSDRYSDVAITWTKPEELGIQRLEAVVGWGGAKITDHLLSWTVSEDGRALALRLKHRNFRPDKVIELDETSDLALKAVAAYPEWNTIAVRFTLFNRAALTRNITIDFDYPGKGIQPDWKGPFPPGQFVRVDNEPQGSWATLYVHHEHGRNVTWVKSFVAGMTEGTTLELECLADLSPRKLHLAPHGRASFMVIMAMGRNHGRAQKAYRTATEKLRQGWSPSAETRRIRAILRQAPELPVKYRGNPHFERMYAHAITGLNSLFIRGEGGYTDDMRIPYTTKDHLAIAFFWDTSFSSVGAREFSAELGQEAIESFVDNATPRGSLPGTLADTHRAGEGQAPIMCWAAWNVYESGHDKAWLSHVYPGLAGYINFWTRYHSSARGLVQFFNAGQIADNDARFDPVYNRTSGNEHGNEAVSGFESPDLNAFLVVEMRSLAKMADALGYSREAAEWRIRAAHLAKLIVDFCYFPGEAMFYDVKVGTHEKFSGVKDPNMFLPLWAEVPLSKSEVQQIVERHMLNPEEFFRELPFPSLSYDNPKYDPSSYWRGRIWPHFVYWMIQTLWRTGYHKEAELTADRLLEMMQKTPWYMENYISSPEGVGKGPSVYSHPEYNWSEATVIELLLQRYKDPAP